MEEVVKNKEIKGIRLLIGYLGFFIFLAGVICLIPLLMLAFFPEEAEHALDFVYPGAGAIILGFIINRIFLKGHSKVRSNLKKGEGATLLLLIWVLSILICSVPFILSGESFTFAVFESANGLGTAGLSVVDPESASNLILFYRGLLLFFGGVGLVLVVTSVISDRYGLRLYTAEGHTDKLMPNLAKSARVMFAIYGGYITLGVIGYVACGMSLFDAVIHSTSAVATGGFTNYASSIGYYDHVGIEIVSMILMLLGSTNFLVMFLLIKGKFKKFWRHSEIRFSLIYYTIFIPLSFIVVFFSSTQVVNLVIHDGILNTEVGGNLAQSFRYSIFHFISAATTTGFTTGDLNAFPVSFNSILVIAMLIGGAAGSTSGGIKHTRICTSFKLAYYNLMSKISFSSEVKTVYNYKFGNEEVIEKDEYIDVMSVVLVYIAVFTLGTFTLMLFQPSYSMLEASFNFSSAMSGTGLSVGQPLALENGGVLWTLIVGVVLGRLEIIPLFLIFASLIKSVTRQRSA